MARCSNCGSSNVAFKRENVGEIRGRSAKQVVHRTVGYCKDCGNTWIASIDKMPNTPKKRKTWLWVLGWLFIFPLPLTILLLRKKEMNNIVKYAIIAIAWLLYFSIAYGGNTKTATTIAPAKTETPVKTEIPVKTETQETSTDVETWDAKFERTKNDVVAYVDNTITPEYQKRIGTTIDYNINDEGAYYATVEIIMAEDTPSYLRNSIKTIEERLKQAPYEINLYLVYSTSKCSCTVRKQATENKR